MNPWATLGLERTDDVAEVRRAYARKLKTIDVEADPIAFVALREALEEAIADARWRQTRQADEVAPVEAVALGEFGGGVSFEGFGPASNIPAWDAPDPDASLDQPEAEPVVVTAAAGEGPTCEADNKDAGGDRFFRLESLLFGDPDASLDADVLEAAVVAIINHPEMDHIQHDSSVQLWLADILVAASPRSDPALATVVDRFGWEKNKGRIDQHWLFDELVQRRRAVAFVNAVADPAHELHKAYVELNRPEERLGMNRWSVRKDVWRLLDLIRGTCPEAEVDLAPHRVALWDRVLATTEGAEAGSPGLGMHATIFGAWMLWLIVKMAGCAAQVGQPPSIESTFSVPANQVYRDAGADLSPVLSHIAEFGVTLEALRERNPLLHGRLIARWHAARVRAEDRAVFRRAASQIIADAFGESLRGGDYAIQATYWRLHADELRSLRDDRARGVEACARLAEGSSEMPNLPANLARRRLALEARALLDPPPTSEIPARRTGSAYTISGQIIGDTIDRSGLPDALLRSALDGRGPAERRCLAHIALIDAILARPRVEVSRLLRDMSAGL